MGTGIGRAHYRLGSRLLGFTLALGLSGCSSWGLLPSQTEVATTDFDSYDSVVSAFDRIEPGRTREADLTRLGFDVESTPNVEILSYLGVIERFMPRDSIKFDDLDPAVRDCVQSRMQCSGYVFRPELREKQRVGNLILDILGFRRTTVEHGWSAEIVLLIQQGQVTHKLFSGKPRIKGTRDKVQPLGPLQDLSGAFAKAAVDEAVD